MSKKEIIIDPDLEQRQKEGYYFQEFYCSNCEKPNGFYKGSVDVMIPKGENSRAILKCPYCGDLSLKK